MPEAQNVCSIRSSVFRQLRRSDSRHSDVAPSELAIEIIIKAIEHQAPLAPIKITDNK
jgi:hypothetical protein